MHTTSITSCHRRGLEKLKVGGPSVASEVIFKQSVLTAGFQLIQTHNSSLIPGRGTVPVAWLCTVRNTIGLVCGWEASEASGPLRCTNHSYWLVRDNIERLLHSVPTPIIYLQERNHFTSVTFLQASSPLFSVAATNYVFSKLMTVSTDLHCPP